MFVGPKVKYFSNNVLKNLELVLYSYDIILRNINKIFLLHNSHLLRNPFRQDRVSKAFDIITEIHEKHFIDKNFSELILMIFQTIFRLNTGIIFKQLLLLFLCIFIHLHEIVPSQVTLWFFSTLTLNLKSLKQKF